MTLRRKLFLFVTFSFSFAVAVGVLHQISLYRKMAKEEKERFCENSFARYTELVDHYKKVANSISSYVAKDPEVKRLLIRDDREALYRRLKPLYDEVSREDLVREMVIFKLPAITYLNIRNPEAPRSNVEDVRLDVVRVGKTCTSTQAILICANYVGIRATNPIA